jgi:hypothetical protein
MKIVQILIKVPPVNIEILVYLKNIEGELSKKKIVVIPFCSDWD